MSPDDPSGWMQKHFDGRHAAEGGVCAFYTSAAPAEHAAAPQTPMQRVPTPSIDLAAQRSQSPPAADPGEAAVAMGGDDSPASGHAPPRSVPSPPRQIRAPPPVKDPPVAPVPVPPAAPAATDSGRAPSEGVSFESPVWILRTASIFRGLASPWLHPDSMG